MDAQFKYRFSHMSVAACLACGMVKEGNDMGFVLGVLIGLLGTIGLFGFVIYWLCTGSNTSALAKLIDGIAQVLAHRPQSPDSSAPDKNAGRWRYDDEESRT